MPLTKEAIAFDKKVEISNAIGRGRDTMVYLATTMEGPFKEVAIKVLVGNKKSELLLNRLKHEATMLLLAEHPRIINLFGMHAEKDRTYLALEYAKYGDLLKFSLQHPSLMTPERGLLFFIQALEGLEHLRNVEIVHRDIKPENILVTSTESVKLGDFGVATLNKLPNLRKDLNLAVGAISYLAPEILAGKVCDHQSDLYSLALSFYHVLTGVHPFDNLPLLQQKEKRESLDIPSPLELRPELSKMLSNTIMKMLAHDRPNRFQSAKEVLDFLEVQAPPKKGKVLRMDKFSRNKLEGHPNGPQNILAVEKSSNTDNVEDLYNEDKIHLNNDTIPDNDFSDDIKVVNSLGDKENSGVLPPETIETNTELSLGTESELQAKPEAKTTLKQATAKHRDMDQEKKKREAQATQSIPSSMLNKFRMGEDLESLDQTAATTKFDSKKYDFSNSTKNKTTKNPDNKSFNVKASPKIDQLYNQTSSSRRRGLIRLILALFTCLSVAALVIYIYGPNQTSLLTRDLTNKALEYTGLSSYFKPATTKESKVESENKTLDDTKSSNSSSTSSFGLKEDDQIEPIDTTDPGSTNTTDAVEVNKPLVSDTGSDSDSTTNSDVTEDDDSNLNSTNEPDNDSGTTPESETLEFIKLGQGINSGQISGIFPENNPTHLTLIHFEEREETVLFLGFNGFKPVAGEIIDGKGTLKFASNGMVLTFSGKTLGNKSFGTVEDLVSGRKGRWKVENVKN